MNQRWGCGEGFLQLVEGALLFHALDGWACLFACLGPLHKAYYGGHNRRIALHEALVEVSEAKEHLDLSVGLWCRPLGNHSNLVALYGNPFCCDRIPKEAYLLGIELTFRELHI
jgi:hypothetical protein